MSSIEPHLYSEAIEDRPSTEVLSESMHITIDRIPFEGKALVRYEPIDLSVKKSECEKYFNVEVDDLDMIFTETSLSKLRSAIHAVLQVKWERLVMEDPSKMTPRTLARRSLLMENYTFG